MELTRDTVSIAWAELGEGMSGDYNEEDPNDVELLRFDIYRLVDGEWEAVDNGSYCTLMPVDTPADIQYKALEFLMDRLHDAVVNDTHKKIAEAMSWIEPGWVSEKQ